MSKKVVEFPRQILKVDLTPIELRMLADLKKLHGCKTNSGLLRRLLQDIAKKEGIKVPRKKKPKPTVDSPA